MAVSKDEKPTSTPAKETASKPTAAKPARAKSTAAKDPAKTAAAKKPDGVKKPGPAKKTASKPSNISPEERYRMVEVAAYYIAERSGFKGSPGEFWAAAEEQISNLLDK